MQQRPRPAAFFLQMERICHNAVFMRRTYPDGTPSERHGIRI